MKRLTKRDPGWPAWPLLDRPRGALCTAKFCTLSDRCDHIGERTCPYLQMVDRLAAIEDTGIEPGEITRILDAYGRGMTLRTENAQRLEIVKDIQTDRLRELVRADREGKFPKYTIGDTVYDRFGRAWEVTSVELHSMRTKNEWLYRCGHKGTDDYCALWHFEAFPSREAALRREQE